MTGIRTLIPYYMPVRITNPVKASLKYRLIGYGYILMHQFKRGNILWEFD
jgi:hypothetical protein